MPIPVPERILHFDFLLMSGAVVLLAPFVFWHLRFGRIVGTVFTGAYVLYVWSQFIGFSGVAAQ